MRYYPVNACYRCPECRFEDGIYYCDPENQDIPDTLSIPDWCRLKDPDADVSALQAIDRVKAAMGELKASEWFNTGARIKDEESPIERDRHVGFVARIGLMKAVNKRIEEIRDALHD